MNRLYSSSPERQDTAGARQRATPVVAASPPVTADKDPSGTWSTSSAGHRLANISIVTPPSTETVRRPPIQPKLTVSQPDDPYEQEADRVAETVMRMPEAAVSGAQPPPFGRARVVARPIGERITPWVQRQSESADEEQEDEVPGPTEIVATKQVVGNPLQRQEDAEEPEQQPEEQSVQEQEQEQESEQSAPVQTKRIGRAPSVSPVLEASLNRTQGQGAALPAGPRQFFEPRFGHDFSRVRVHADGAAAQAAQSLNAQAFTRGSDIYFGAGRYQPQTRSGRHLLAHELTHTVQQRSGTPPGATTDLKVSHPADAAEQEAGAAADAVMAGRNFAIRASSGVMLSRNGGDEPEQVERRQSEVEMTIRQMTSALSSINAVGAEVEFLFWTSHGAITLVDFRRRQQGGAVVRPFTSAVLDDFAAAELRVLPTFVGTHERYVKITVRRTERTWVQQSFDTATPQGAPARPPEGRTIPISRQGYSVDTFSRSSDVASEIVRLLRVPRNATAELVATLELDDDRIVSWSPESYRATEGQSHGLTASAAPDVSFNIHAILLPLTSGLGRRTVRMVLRGRHSGGAANSIWDVAEAGVVRPAVSSVDEAAEIVNEYRHTHEQILVQWRQGVRDAGVYVAMIGLREAAFWLVGGVVFRVLGVGVRAVAPTLYRLISPGTRVAAEYLETLIVRLLPAEKAELRALAAKAETEGLEALSVAERARLNAIWTRLEQLISSPITNVEKGYLRTAMHGRYQAVRAAEAAAFDAAGRAYQVHHRLPLEYGHLFPGFDVNAGSNLIGLDVTVHRGVNAVWTRFRTVPAGRITPQAVDRVAAIVDRRFAQWYHQVPTAQGLGATVEAAKNSALGEVDILIRTLSP